MSKANKGNKAEKEFSLGPVSWDERTMVVVSVVLSLQFRNWSEPNYETQLSLIKKIMPKDFPSVREIVSGCRDYFDMSNISGTSNYKVDICQLWGFVEVLKAYKWSSSEAAAIVRVLDDCSKHGRSIFLTDKFGNLKKSAREEFLALASAIVDAEEDHLKIYKKA